MEQVGDKQLTSASEQGWLELYLQTQRIPGALRKYLLVYVKNKAIQVMLRFEIGRLCETVLEKNNLKLFEKELFLGETNYIPSSDKQVRYKPK